MIKLKLVVLNLNILEWRGDQWVLMNRSLSLATVKDLDREADVI